jgi:hypothetical protein
LTETKENEQIIRISEFNKLISSLVGEEDAPYIYERLGTHMEHFLLDEFQDTSRLQWLNLIPLVHESLGNGRRNLIVGDAKQSIYRFNNGLAEQFVSLPKIFNPEKDVKILDIGQIPLIKKPSSSCSKCYGRGQIGRDSTNLSYQICKCIRKNIDFDLIKSLLPEPNPS